LGVVDVESVVVVVVVDVPEDAFFEELQLTAEIIMLILIIRIQRRATVLKMGFIRYVFRMSFK